MMANGGFDISVVRELAELHKANASRASEVEEAALSRETQAKEQLSLALEKAQEEGRIQQEALANQVKLTHPVDTRIIERCVCYVFILSIKSSSFFDRRREKACD